MNDSLKIMSIAEASNLPGVLLWKVSKLWQQRVNAALSDLGLSSTNAVILTNVLHLHLEHKRTTQAVLATISNVDLMTTSQALRTLEKKGLISRHTAAADKRAFEISLTPDGKRVANDALRRIARTHEMFFASMQTSNNRAPFTNTLRALLEANTTDATKLRRNNHKGEQQ